MERDRLLAWNTAKLAGIAFNRSLPPLSECFPDPDAQEATNNAALLSAMFKLKAGGIPMEIERLTLQ